MGGPRPFVEPDHLTSLWVPRLAAPVAAELVALDELVRTLRQRCPWDRRQTHASLGRHLLEESYEVLEAIDGLAAVDADLARAPPGPRWTGREAAVADLEEELGDLLFQVYFHATLAAEEGRFTLADVARGIHDKLVSRHPHVFGDVTAETADDVAANWEAIKKVEKGRSSVTEGIPAALPSLALAAKLQRKAAAIGMVLPGLADEAVRVADAAGAWPRTPGTPTTVADGEGGARGRAEAVGELLFAAVGVARPSGWTPRRRCCPDQGVPGRGGDPGLRPRAVRAARLSGGGRARNTLVGRGAGGSVSHTASRSDARQ